MLAENVSPYAEISIPLGVECASEVRGLRSTLVQQGDVMVLPSALAAAIEEAMRAGNAEIVIETTSGRAGIFATEGSVAWVVGPRSATRLSEVLVERTSVSRRVLQETFKSCRKTGANFAEALIAAGHVGREQMRRVLVAHHANQLRELVSEPLVRMVVVPRTRAYASDLVFSLEEILRAATLEAEVMRLSPPLVAPVEKFGAERVKACLDEVLSIEGAFACALVDVEAGATLGSSSRREGFDVARASTGNIEMVRAQLEMSRALGLDGMEDVLITLGNQFHLVRLLGDRSSFFLYAAIDRETGNLAYARHRLRIIGESLIL